MPGDYQASDGRRYAFDDAYFEALDRARPLAAVATTPLQDSAANPYAAERVGLMHFLGKAYEAAVLADALARHGRRGRFGRALDIGAGPALQSRFLKAAGIIGRNEAIDVYDGRGRCPESRFWPLLLATVALHGGYRAFCLLPEGLRDRIAPRLSERLPIGRRQFGLCPALEHFAFLPRPGASVSRYSVGDVYDLDDGQYDLVTSFMALDYFDFDRIAEKACALLRPGGTFAFLVSYWWYPVNNTLLYGRFPYLLQRLAPQEVLRYFRATHPEILDAGIERRLGYSDQRRPTVADYQEIAFAKGLRPVATTRLAPADAHANDRAVIGPLAIDRRNSSALGQVLADARRWQPRVTLADLLTSHVLMVFEKADA